MIGNGYASQKFKSFEMSASDDLIYGERRAFYLSRDKIAGFRNAVTRSCYMVVPNTLFASIVLMNYCR